MKIDDLITEAPMGLGKTLSTKLKSYVPGSIGARAKGELDIGKVANVWKKDYSNFLGKLGQEGFGNTKTLIAFLKTLGFTHKQMQKVFRGGGFSESAQIYEANLSSKMIDTLMTRAARVGAMAAMGVDRPLPKEPNPTAPRKPGAIDAMVDIGKKVAPQVSKAAADAATKAAPVLKTAASKAGQTASNVAGKVGQSISQVKMPKPNLGAIKSPFKTKSPQQRVEPTIQMPQDQQPVVQTPKYQPTRQAPKMKTKKVIKYK